VYATSTAVYGLNPAPYKESDPCDLNTPYAESKKLLEDAALKLQSLYPGVVFVGLRYCNVYGPREYHKGSRSTMIYQFAHQMQKGNPLLFCYGEQRRDYIYVKDVVRANMLASAAPESCVVNCGSGRATTFKRLVELLNDTLKLNRTPEYIANPYEGNYQAYTECDMTLAREKIGFIPEYSIEKGICDYHESGFLLKV
ncbi:MAG: NAD-dependent epimerase/dehydratase family protein, partial [Deltaproteobacteria bacterium]|nr:NAD-dependent epimerase/dehydratase family protein [Deltaproteobacteria bacterium]